MMESFWSSMQRELLDRRTWSSREELASAIFEWIEGFYNPVRRHSGLGYQSPNDFEDLHTAATAAACSPHRNCPGNRVRLPLGDRL